MINNESFEDNNIISEAQQQLGLSISNDKSSKEENNEKDDEITKMYATYLFFFYNFFVNRI
jgi:hypothetical protein